MADTPNDDTSPAEEAGEQATEEPLPDGYRRVSPERMVVKLTQRIGQMAQEHAGMSVLVDELGEELAARDQALEEMREQLVAATSARPPARPAGRPAARPAGRAGGRNGSGR